MPIYAAMPQLQHMCGHPLGTLLIQHRVSLTAVMLPLLGHTCKGRLSSTRCPPLFLESTACFVC
jgi:hypothetical protein